MSGGRIDDGAGGGGVDDDGGGGLLDGVAVRAATGCTVAVVAAATAVFGLPVGPAATVEITVGDGTVRAVGASTDVAVGASTLIGIDVGVVGESGGSVVVGPVGDSLQPTKANASAVVTTIRRMPVPRRSRV